HRARVLPPLGAGGEPFGERRRDHLVEAHDGALRLRDDLLADGDDVVRLEPDAGALDRVAEEDGEIVPRPDHGQPGHRNDGDGHRSGAAPSAPSTAPARQAARAVVVMSVSVTTARMPSASTRGASAASARSSTKTLTTPR